MGEGLGFFDIIVFAAIAAFLVLRLRGVLGKRTGHEQTQRYDPFRKEKPEESAQDKVIQLPDRGTGPADPAAELPADSRVGPAEILGQAANAWLLADRDDEALRLIDEALVMTPDAPALHVDRARILAHHGQYAAALADLDKALAADPTDDDALAFRASALRRQGRLVDALADATTALEINPDNASARLERGIIRKALGDIDAARTDWRETVERHAGTPAGDAASEYLRSLN